LRIALILFADYCRLLLRSMCAAFCATYFGLLDRYRSRGRTLEISIMNHVVMGLGNHSRTFGKYCCDALG